MRATGLIFALLACLLGGVIIMAYVLSGYHWRNEYLNHWTLADRSSTIAAKQKHLEDFVDALENGNKQGRFASYNAIFLQTPSNNFRNNMMALETLSERLTEIQNMDPNSFQYNTAIQQITAQEQGEAHELLEVLSGCYYLANYPLIWDWVGVCLVIAIIIVGLFGGGVFFATLD